LKQETVREIYIARLARKQLLSEPAQCYHFEFAFEGAAPAPIKPGQFLSMLADDPAGKTYTRAYSIASAPYVNADGAPGFDLCVNRVEAGFFSNLLCDMREGEALRCHGPHGLFTLSQPVAETLLIAAGTGIAPMRGFLQSLFSERTHEHPVRLIYEAARPDEFFYSDYFQQLASRHTNFHYCPVDGREGEHGELETAIARISGEGGHAYVCGLSEFVKVARAQLLAAGWQKPQILFERYD
jgi:ferredoxin-NADP reductase